MRLGLRSALLLALPVYAAPPANAQFWNPFEEFTKPSRPRVETRPEPGAGADTAAPPPDVFGPPAGGVERGDLAPIMADDGSGLPYGLWQSLPAGVFEEHLARLALPPRSAVLHALWTRLLMADAGAGGAQARRLVALRAEALDRSGLVRSEVELLRHATQHETARDPVLAVLVARAEIGVGERERGCAALAGVDLLAKDIPDRMRAEAVLMLGYCAAVSDDMPGAALKAGLARELGLEAAAAADALEAIASDLVPRIDARQTVSLLHYRILELKPGLDAAPLIAKASPALLSALAASPVADQAARIAAAEGALAVNAVTAPELAALYRTVSSSAPAAPEPEAGKSAPTSGGAPARARLFKTIEAERSPVRRARAIGAYLDDARRAGFYTGGLEIVAPASREIAPAGEVAWFAEIAIEVALATGDIETARAWAAIPGDAGRPSVAHWAALADIVDPAPAGGRGRHLATVETMALDGRFDAGLLHRLATALDALDIQVPMKLWDVASRAPQPKDGHLPDTGVLSDLGDAAKKKDTARTILLVMRTLGPQGPEGAHMLALGDSIRALRRAGLEVEARRVAFEALVGRWPRSVSN